MHTVQPLLHIFGHGCLLLPNIILLLSLVCFFHVWYILWPVLGHCSFYVPCMVGLSIPYCLAIFTHFTLWCLSQSLCCIFSCRKIQQKKQTPEKETLIKKEDEFDVISPLINVGVIMINFLIVVSILIEVFIIIIGIVSVFLSVFTQPGKYNGHQTISGIDNDIKIIRNSYGHIHVKAKTKKDMFFGQGFAQAQERIFQMELGKRLATGKLSEILGSSALSTDEHNRAIGFLKYGKINEKNMSPVYREYINSFVKGINSYIDSNSLNYPIEFKMLNIVPSKWTIDEVAAFSLWVGNSQSTNYGVEMERLNWLINVGLKPERIEQYFSSPEHSKVTILNSNHLNSLNLKMTKNETELLAKSIKKEFEFLKEFQTKYKTKNGIHVPYEEEMLFKPEYENFNSNNFAISGNLTKSGKAIVESDPHTSLAAPNFYFTMHLETENSYNAQGATIAGIPSVIIGKNDFISWGATNPLVDTVDLFLVETNTNQSHYYRNNEWIKFETREETFNIKDAPTLTKTIKETVYGSIINNNILKNSTLLTAFSSSLLLDNNTSFESFIELGESKNWDNFTNALRKYTFAPISFVYGDIEGNIGYYVPGRLPIRSFGHSGRYPTFGNGSYDWNGFVPFEELPHIYNPPEGFVITANNKIAPNSYKHQLSYYYAPGYRATRISEMIKSLGNQITVDDVLKIQLDEYATDFYDYKPIFSKMNITNSYHSKWLNKLLKWNGNSKADVKSTEATVYFFWYRCYRRVHEKEASHSRVAMEPFLKYTLTNGTNFCPVNIQCFKFAEDCLISTLDKLNLEQNNYRWGVDVHGQSFSNQIFEMLKIPCLGSRRSLRGGNSYSVNTAWHVDPVYNSVTKKYEIENNYGSAYRHVAHLGENDSKFVLGMGQSGNIFSKNYDDLVEPWRKGDFFKMEKEMSNPKHSEIDMKNIREFYLSTKKNNFFVLKNEKEAIFGFIALEAKSKDKLEIKRFIVEKTQNNENLEKLFEKAKQFAEEIKMKKMVLTCSSYEKSLIDFCSKKKFQLKNTQKIKQIESYDFEFELN
eukprot:gene2124-1990_t